MVNKYRDFATEAQNAEAERPGPTKAAANKFSQFRDEEEAPATVDKSWGRGEDDAWYDKTGRFALDALRNFNDTATFGLFTKGLEATGIDPNAQAKLDEVDANNPWAGVAGDVAGYVLPGMAASSAVAKAVPALARNSIPALMGREGLANAAVSTADDVFRTGEIDPMGVLIDSAIGAGAAGAIGLAGRVISPTARVRAMGNNLDPIDRIAAMTKMADAERVGIKLNVPEAVQAGAPSKATSLLSGLDNAANTPKGADALNSFNELRKPGIAEAGSKLVDDLGGGISPQAVQESAEAALKNRSAIVRNSAQPYYDVADQALIPSGDIPRTAGTKDAMRSVAQDKSVVEALSGRVGGPVKPNSVAFLDTAKKELDAMAQSNFDKGRAYKGSIYADDARGITDAIDPLVPEYPIAREVTEGGTRANKELANGPLGLLAQTPSTSGQGSALFDVNTSVDSLAAQRASRFLGRDESLGILANRVEGAVADDPLGFGTKVLPNQHSREVANGLLGPGDHWNTLDAAANVRTPNVLPAERGTGGPVDAIWDYVRGLGGGKIVEDLMNPETLNILGKTGPVQQGLTLSSSAATQASDIGGRTSGKARKMNRSR